MPCKESSCKMERKKHRDCLHSSNLGEERFRRKISKVKMLSRFLKEHKDSYSIKKKIVIYTNKRAGK